MSDYVPDRWMIVKIGGSDPHYRVFGTWFGGYASGDSWRMNSGITDVEDEGDYYNFLGSSGSCYMCYKDRYGSSMYGHGVMKQYSDRHGDKFQVLEDREDWNSDDIDWIIS